MILHTRFTLFAIRYSDPRSKTVSNDTLTERWPTEKYVLLRATVDFLADGGASAVLFRIKKTPIFLNRKNN